MKVIDLGNRIIFTDDIQYIYNSEKAGEYYNSTIYYIVTKVGKFEVDKYEYAKVKECLLSLNDEIEIKEDEYIELSNKYERLNNRNEELQEENEKLKKELEIETDSSDLKAAQIEDRRKRIEELKEKLDKIEEMFKNETLDKYYHGMSYEFEIDEFRVDILKIIKGSE